MRLFLASIAPVVVAVATACGGTTADVPASDRQPQPEPQPNAPPRPQSRAPWPMVGQGPAHQSRSVSTPTAASHRSWELEVDGDVAGSCVIAEDGTIYVASRTTLFAISPTGAVKWTAPVQVDESSPAIGPDGTVYVADAAGGTALDAFTNAGVLKWRALVQGGPELGSLSSPTVAPDGTIYVATMSGPLNAIAPDGSVRWSAGMERFSTPAIGADGTVFTMEVSTYSSHVDAFGAGGAQTYRVGGLGFIESYLAFPVVGQDASVYVAATGLFALSATGIHWAQPLETSHPPAVGIDGTIYVSGVSASAVVAALRPEDGSRKWTYAEPSDWATNYFGPLAVAADGKIYAGGNTLRVLSRDGALLQTIDVGSPIVAPLAIDADGTVIFAAMNDTIYAR